MWDFFKNLIGENNKIKLKTLLKIAKENMKK